MKKEMIFLALMAGLMSFTSRQGDEHMQPDAGTVGSVAGAGVAVAGTGMVETTVAVPAKATGLLAKLQPADSLRIEFSSFGCFHSYSSKMIFINREQGIEVVQMAGRNNMAKQRLVTDSVIARKIMTEADFAAFAEFEAGLKLVRSMNCTTHDSYAISSKYDSIGVTDGSCGWNGFGKLTNAIFPPVNAE